MILMIKQFWYYRDPSYKAEITELPKEQQDWINYWTSYDRISKSKGVFNYKTTNLFNVYYIGSLNIQSAADETSQKTLRNVPFAYRGYVFSDPLIQSYFERQTWYKAKPNYKPEIKDLSRNEKEWVERWSK